MSVESDLYRSAVAYAAAHDCKLDVGPGAEIILPVENLPDKTLCVEVFLLTTEPKDEED